MLPQPKGPATREPATPGDYGVVFIAAGRHRGKLGYYDDEDDDCDSAVVYLGPPGITPCLIVRHMSLRAASKPEVAWWHAHRNNDFELARAARVLRAR